MTLDPKPRDGLELRDARFLEVIPKFGMARDERFPRGEYNPVEYEKK